MNNWILYNNTLYHLLDGTAIFYSMVEGRPCVVISPSAPIPNREIACKSTEEAKELFANIRRKLCPGDFVG